VIATILVIRRDLVGARAGGRARSARPPRSGRTNRRQRRQERRGAAQHLVVTQGGLAGTRLPLGAVPVTIGRADDSTLVLADDYVSTRHARLLPRDGQWLVEDLGSTNGTYLASERVVAPTPVPLGVPIRVGKTVLELRR
jgi:pSer/pThr/pTyr-binding forkhead associated (FHA) protein